MKTSEAVVASISTHLCVCCGVWCCKTTAGTSCPPPPRPRPPPQDRRPPQLDSGKKPAAAESERFARPQLENKRRAEQSASTMKQQTEAEDPLTFLRVLDDLPDGLLQTVGPQHQLLSGFEDSGSCRGRGVDARGAGGGAERAM